MNSLGTYLTVLALALLLPAGVLAAAPISTIAPGNTVFFGEQGLDITSAMEGDTQIGWWASAASISTSSPSYTISVATPSAFFISPTDFAGKAGVWYHLDSTGKANGTAFTVADPNLDIRVYDATVNVDATANGWITAGDEVEFRINTNLYQIAQRPGVSAVPIQLHVEAPDGGSFSALVNSAGTATSLLIPVTSSPYSTGAIWDTSRRDTYPPGSYNIWAECNVNSMKDNYPNIGRTYTTGSRLLDQERNPLIGASTRTQAVTTVATPVRTTRTTALPTTLPPTPATTVPATVITTIETTAAAPVTTTAAPAATRSPGFGPVLAGSALLIALAWAARKE